MRQHRTAYEFPLGKTGGLIEAPRHSGSAAVRYSLFPLGKTGGLIEALTAPVRAGVPLRSFRWVKPAASLKRRRAAAWRSCYQPFPLGKTGGLIEAPCCRRCSGGTTHGFPLGKTGGLIEAA